MPKKTPMTTEKLEKMVSNFLEAKEEYIDDLQKKSADMIEDLLFQLHKIEDALFEINFQGEQNI